LADAILIPDHFVADHKRELFYEATNTPDNVTPAWTEQGGSGSNVTTNNSDGTVDVVLGDATIADYYWKRTPEGAFDDGSNYTAKLIANLNTGYNRNAGDLFGGIVVLGGREMLFGFYDIDGNLKIGFFDNEGAAVGSALTAVVDTDYNMRVERDDKNAIYRGYVDNVFLAEVAFATLDAYASTQEMRVGFEASTVGATGTMTVTRWEFKGQGPIVASSENTNFPTENLYSKSQGKVFRSATNYASVNLVKDFGEALGIDFFAILNTNIPASATLKIQANATDSWGAPSVDQTVTITNIATDKSAFYYWASTQTFQFWRIVIQDTTEALHDEYYQIGEWILGLATQLSHNWGWGYTKKTIQNNVDQVTPYGKTWSYHRNKERVYNIGFVNASLAAHDDMIGVFNDAQGSNSPMAFVPDPASETEPFYMRTGPEFSVQHPFLNLFDFTIDLVEDPRGIDVG